MSKKIRVGEKENYNKLLDEAEKEIRDNLDKYNNKYEAADEIAEEFTGSLSTNLTILYNSYSSLSEEWNVYTLTNRPNYTEIIDAMAYDVLRQDLEGRL